LPMMGFLYRSIKPGQECQPLQRDPRLHHAPVLGFAAARGQATLLQAVEQPSDVGISCNHAISDFAASEPVRCSAQYPEHVVLRRREILGLQNLSRPSRQHVGRTQQVEERHLLGARSPPRLAFRWARFTHPFEGYRYNDYCQDDFLACKNSHFPFRVVGCLRAEVYKLARRHDDNFIDDLAHRVSARSSRSRNSAVCITVMTR